MKTLTLLDSLNLYEDYIFSEETSEASLWMPVAGKYIKVLFKKKQTFIYYFYICFDFVLHYLH